MLARRTQSWPEMLHQSVSQRASNVDYLDQWWKLLLLDACHWLIDRACTQSIVHKKQLRVPTVLTASVLFVSGAILSVPTISLVFQEQRRMENCVQSESDFFTPLFPFNELMCVRRLFSSWMSWVKYLILRMTFSRRIQKCEQIIASAIKVDWI